MAVAGVKADLCRNWPALGTVSEGCAAHASQLSVSGFSFMLVGHLEGKAYHGEKQATLNALALHSQRTQACYVWGFLMFKGQGRGRNEPRLGSEPGLYRQ